MLSDSIQAPILEQEEEGQVETLLDDQNMDMNWLNADLIKWSWWVKLIDNLVE